MKILLVESDRMAAVELRDFLHFLGHAALWSEDGLLLPEGCTFDLVMLAWPDAPGEGAAIVDYLAGRRAAPAMAIMSDGGKQEMEAACAFAAARGFRVFGPLPKPLRPEQVAAALEAPLRIATGRSGAGPVNVIVPGAREASYVFQSKHALGSGTVVGFDTLLRMPGVGTIKPWFARLDHGSAFAMTLAAARAALGLSGRFGRAARRSPVAFRCPPQIFGDARFLAQLTELSARARAKGESSRVAVEISGTTNRATLSDIAPIAFRYVLAGFELHLGGFSMDVDGLEHLVRLPISEARIDRSSLGSLLNDDPLLLGEVVSLFRLRNIRSTVSRIESSDEYDVARQAGVDCGQGYYWSQPSAGVRP